MVRLAGKICHIAAGLLTQEYPGGGVPLVEAKFPESFKAAGGHAGEVQRGGAVAAHAVRAQREIPVVVNVGTGYALVRGKARAEQAGGQGLDLRDANGVAVER